MALERQDFALKTCKFCGCYYSGLFERTSKMDTCNEKLRHILQISFNKGEYASQTAENMYSVYGLDIVTANHIPFR